MANVIVRPQRNIVRLVASAIPAGPGSGDYQPLDGDLTALAALSGTGWARRTGTSTWTLATPTYTDVGADAAGSAAAVAVVGAAALAAHEAAADPHPGYLTEAAAAAAYQPLDGDLTALAALSGTGWARRTGTSTWTLDAPSATGLALIAATDAAAARSAIGLTDARYQEQLHVSTAAWSSTSITLSDVTGVTFTPDASAVYLIELYIAYDSASTTVGLEVALDPGNADMGSLFMIGRGGASSSGIAYYGSTLAAMPQITTTTALAGGSANPVSAWVVLRTTASPTAVKLQCGAEVGGTEVRIAAGMATLRVRRLA